jgi:RHS repeat-associated protein
VGKSVGRFYKPPATRQTAGGFTLPKQTFGKKVFSTGSLKGLSVAVFVISVIAGGVLWESSRINAVAPLVLGELPYQTTTEQSLSDRADVLVNVANGNLVFKTQDLTVSSPGPDLSITRYFNDRGSGAGQIGERGTLSVGADIKIVSNTNGSATYHGPSGFQVTFQPNGSGGYTTPAEFTAATLTNVTGGGWKLTHHTSGDVFTFNSAGTQTKHADNTGLAITYAYNTNGTLASATDAQGKVTTFSNYSGTKIGTITDPAGRTIEYDYDTSGRLSDVTDTNGKTWQFEYWDGTNLTWVVDPRGYSTNFEYDGSNRVELITYNNYTSNVTEWEYVYHQDYTQVYDPLDHDTDYYYDSLGRVTSTVDPAGNTVSDTWDSNNNKTAITDPTSQVNTLAYDSLNNLTSSKRPDPSGGGDGAEDTYDYTHTAHPHRPSKKTDSSGNYTEYSYSSNGSLTSAVSKSASGTSMGTFTYTYQGGTVNCGALSGQLCTKTDANSNTTTYSYDTDGNVTSISPPGPISDTTYTYDTLSRVKTITDGNGSKVTITYDNADRPTLLTYAQDSSTVSYSYDNHGNLLQRVDAAGTSTWEYDGFNRITKVKQSGKTDITYTYDLAGNLKTEAGPAGTTTYSYNADNTVQNIHQPNNVNHIFVYAYGRPTTIYMPGDIIQYMTYDQAGRQTSVKAVRNGTTLTHYTGTYLNASGDDTDLLQSETDHVASITSGYVYDGKNRLTEVNGSGTGSNDYTYSYDAMSNRTQQSKNGVYSAIYGYNAANQLVTDGGVESGTYDAAGNQTSTGTGLSMTYNAKNQTSAFTPPGGSAITATYSDAGHVERTKIGATTQRNGALGLYSDTTSGTTTHYSHMPTGNGQAISQKTGSNNYSYLTDLRGSVVKLTDSTGTVKATYSYEPYGKALTSTGTVTSPHRYAGGYYDTATELYKFGARYYNPEDARWTQLDPSGLEETYVYAEASPVSYVDPSGYFRLSFECARTLGFGFFGGGVALGAGAFGIATATTGVGIGIGLAGGLAGVETLDSALYDIQVEGVCG